MTGEGQDLTEKQTYLRETIMETGYDPNTFTTFLLNSRGTSFFNLENGDDINN